jgi:hypothetical protein
MTMKDGLPMREFTLSDGTVIDVHQSGRCAGPGIGGQHFGTSYTYVRANGGEWQKGERSMYRTFEAIECCETLADFLELFNE